MLGYWIPEEKYKELGLDKNREFNRAASHTLMVFVEEECSGVTFTPEQRQYAAMDICANHAKLLDGMVDWARQFGTEVEEYEWEKHYEEGYNSQRGISE